MSGSSAHIVTGPVLVFGDSRARPRRSGLAARAGATAVRGEGVERLRGSPALPSRGISGPRGCAELGRRSEAPVGCRPRGGCGRPPACARPRPGPGGARAAPAAVQAPVWAPPAARPADANVLPRPRAAEPAGRSDEGHLRGHVQKARRLPGRGGGVHFPPGHPPGTRSRGAAGWGRGDGRGGRGGGGEGRSEARRTAPCRSREELRVYQPYVPAGKKKSGFSEQLTG